jgi:hypothetical protein
MRIPSIQLFADRADSTTNEVRVLVFDFALFGIKKTISLSATKLHHPSPTHQQNVKSSRGSIFT